MFEIWTKALEALQTSKFEESVWINLEDSIVLGSSNSINLGQNT